MIRDFVDHIASNRHRVCRKQTRPVRTKHTRPVRIPHRALVVDYATNTFVIAILASAVNIAKRPLVRPSRRRSRPRCVPMLARDEACVSSANVSVNPHTVAPPAKIISPVDSVRPQAIVRDTECVIKADACANQDPVASGARLEDANHVIRLAAHACAQLVFVNLVSATRIVHENYPVHIRARTMDYVLMDSVDVISILLASHARYLN